MELTQENIEQLIKQKEVEMLLVRDMQLEQSDAQYLACRLLNHSDELMGILTAEYKIEVTRI